jgi:hypothetical protein
VTLPCRTAVVAVAIIATCTPTFVQPPVPTIAIINGKVFTGVSILRQRLSMMPDEQAQEKVLRDTAAAAVGLGITSVQLMATNRPAAQLARTTVVADLPIRVRVIDFPMTGIASCVNPRALRSVAPRA